MRGARVVGVGSVVVVDISDFLPFVGSTWLTPPGNRM
jgi:hypothetical protein